MEENKQKIVQLLLPAIQATRNGEDVVSMSYEKKGSQEIVSIEFTSGYRLPCNVSLDSGTAMIRDICAALQ